MEARTIESQLLGSSRRVWVYTPAAYDAKRSDPYDLLVVFDGEEYVPADTALPTMLDNLIAAGTVPPLIAVMVDNGSGAARLHELANSAQFLRALSDEFVPWARRNWNVARDPQRTWIAGASAGGLAAAYAAFKRPDLFGKVLSQSGGFWRGNEASKKPPYEWLTAQYKRSPKLPVKFYLEVGALETAHTAGGAGPAFIEAVRHFRDVLQTKGYTLHYKEVPGARHERAHWRKELPEGLIWLAHH